MKRDPGKEHTILLNIIHGFTSPQLAHIEKNANGKPILFYANEKPISFQKSIPSSFIRAITCLSTCRCGSFAFHLLPHNSYGPQSAPFGGKRVFVLSCASSSVQSVCSCRPTWAQVQETWEIKQNHSSKFQFCLSHLHHRGVSGKGSQWSPKTPASVRRYLWEQDNSRREHSSAQTNAKMSFPFAFRVALPTCLCFIFQLS